MENYVRMFTRDPQFIHALKVTFTYVFQSVPLKLVFALLIALLLDRGLRGLDLHRTVYYIPTLLGSSVAIAMMWRMMFGADGAVNHVRAITSFSPPDWVANPNYSLYTIVLLSVWQFGSTMIIFMAGLKQIPSEFHEAARIDGANDIQRLFRITIPLLTPVILFNLMNSDQRRISGLYTGIHYQRRQGRPYRFDVSLIPSLILFFSLQKYFVDGIATTGLKG